MTTDELRVKFESWWLRNGDPFDLHKVAAWGAWQAAHASRDAEVEALRKDAERYRWLRKNHNADLLAEDIIDEAIDAAMQEDKK